MTHTGIRDATSLDHAKIDDVLTAAFNGSGEAQLVRALRQSGNVILERVSVADGEIIGHILFSGLQVTSDRATLTAVALAPLSVTPSRQRAGTGTDLVNTSHQRLAALGIELSVVLGHPGYYPRFGYSADLAIRLRAPYSGRSFMALELKMGALGSHIWDVRYAEAFSQ